MKYVTSQSRETLETTPKKHLKKYETLKTKIILFYSSIFTINS